MTPKTRVSLDIPSTEMAKLSKLAHIERKTKSYLLREALHLLFEKYSVEIEDMQSPVEQVNRKVKPNPVTRHVSYYLNAPLSQLLGEK